MSRRRAVAAIPVAALALAACGGDGDGNGAGRAGARSLPFRLDGLLGPLAAAVDGDPATEVTRPR